MSGLSDLPDTLAEANAMATAFAEGLRSVEGAMAETQRQAAGLERGLARGLRQAFDGLVFGGAALGDTLKGLARSSSNAAYSSAMKPVTDQLASGVTGLMTGLLGGKVTAFAKGGVVTSPTHFGMQGGTGLMGEAGPEAIMPLARGADGRLGVRMNGGGGVAVTMNVTARDVEGFSRSKGQIAAQLSRLLAQSSRNS